MSLLSIDDQLVRAAEDGKVKKVRSLLSEGADLNATDDEPYSFYGYTPLHHAARKGHVEVARLLLGSEGINVNATATNANDDGNTPLHIAACNGRDEVARLLLDAEGINANAVNSNGMTPLHLAARDGRAEVASGVLLILVNNNGINVNAVDNDGNTPLHRAASFGHIEAVKHLLHGEIRDVNAADKKGKTPLFLAAQKGRVEVVRALLGSEGIDVNSAAEFGRTPLHCATKSGHVETVKALLGAEGVNLNSLDSDGETPLHLSVRTQYPDVLPFGPFGHCLNGVATALLEAEGVSVNAVNKNGSTPLHIAVRCGHAYTVHGLLNTKEIDANCVDNEGHRPLDIAKQRNDAVIVALLEGFLNRISQLTFHQVEQEYSKRKRHKSMVDLTDGTNTGEHIQPDETVIPLRAQVELHRIKQEKETSLDSLDVARATVAELTQKLEAAKKDEMALKETLEDMKECIACQEADKCIAFFPCRHLALCATCSKNESIVTCPMCRCVIKERREVKVVS